MSYTYNAGGTTPTYAGLVEFNGLRINDGTFKSQSVPLIVSTAPVRDSVSASAGDTGGFASDPYYDPWPFEIEGWLWVPTGPDDVQAAIDNLKAAFNLNAGLQQMTVNARGWSAKRYITCRVAGAVVITEPDLSSKKVPRRDFAIPMVAPDPRLYNADATFSVNISPGGTASVTNAGTAPAPFTARFVGPLTNPYIDGPGRLLFNRIRLNQPDGTDYVIGSGHYVDVTTNTAQGGVTAVTDTGVDVYAKVANFSARTIGPGTETWSATADAGTGHVTITLRDTY